MDVERNWRKQNTQNYHQNHLDDVDRNVNIPRIPINRKQTWSDKCHPIDSVANRQWRGAEPPMEHFYKFREVIIKRELFISWINSKENTFFHLREQILSLPFEKSRFSLPIEGADYLFHSKGQILSSIRKDSFSLPLEGTDSLFHSKEQLRVN